MAVDSDDVLPSLHKAIDLLPPSADLLYLGWCFEECRRTQYAEPPPERATNSDSRRMELMKLSDETYYNVKRDVELIKVDGPERATNSVKRDVELIKLDGPYCRYAK